MTVETGTNWKAKPLGAHREAERQLRAYRLRIEREAQEKAHRQLRELGMDEADILAAEQEGYTFTVNLDHELIAKYRCDRCTAYCTEESRTKSASINNLADLGRLINYVDSCTCIEAG